jgi:uncharacterized protein with ParB-like and HNH nuclease domain
MPILVKLEDQSVEPQTLFSGLEGIKQFVVGSVQRRYKWGTPQLNSFWNDITEAFTRPEIPYHLGSIMVVPSDQPGVYSVLDGQQRLTTLSMLFGVIRNKCISLAEDSATAADDVRRLEARARGCLKTKMR